MATLVQDDYIRYSNAPNSGFRSGIRGTATNEVTLNDSTNATTSQVTLKNVATPTTANDAVNKQYVDGLVVAGVTWKNAAVNATTANITLGSVGDGSQLATATIDTTPTFTIADVGSRIVVKNQGTATQNGIYVLTLCTNVSFFYWARSTDAAATDPANGAAIFVYSGSVNNDKAFVVTNDAAVNWNGGVVFSVMSSVPAVIIGGSDTQVQYNNSGSLGADGSFTYNKTAATPILGLGGTATGLTTLNLGTGAQASTIAGVGTGLLTVSGAGATSVISTSANLTLQAATSGNVIVDTATNDWTFNGITLSSQAGATIQATAANLTLQAATSGNVIVDTATNDWTFNGTSLTSQAAASVVSTSANLTLQAATSGNVIVDTATNDWTFNGTTFSSAAAAIVASTAADLTLQATTSGNVIVDTATNDWTFNGTTLSSAGAATVQATGADLTLSTTTSGNVIIDSADITPGASDLTGTNLRVAGQTVTAAAAENYSFSTFSGTVAGTTTGFVTSAMFEAPSGGTVTSRFTTALAGSTSGYIGFSADATTTTYGVTWPSAVAGGANYTLVSDTSGVLSWVAPGGSMLALPENQIYVGDAGTAVASGTSVTVDQNNIVATPTLNIAGTGNTVASTSGTINLGTTSSGTDVDAFINMAKGTGVSTIAHVGTGLLTVSSAGATTVSSTAADLTLQAATSGNVVIDTNANDWTFNGTTLSSQAAAIVSSTAADLTLQAATSGNVVIDTAGNDWTFNGIDLSSAGAAQLQALNTGTVSLFDTTTTGNVTAFIGLTTGSITIGNSASTGNIDINTAGSFSAGLTSTGLFLGNGATTTTAELNGINTTVTGATSLTLTGILINVGDSSTGNLNLSAGADGGIVGINAGTATTLNTVGGPVYINAGTGNGTAAGGLTQITAGEGGATGTGGNVLIDAGLGGATSGAGGAVIISAGDAAAGVSNGGNVSLLAGSKSSTGTDGNIILTTGGPNSNVSATTNIISFNTTTGEAARMEADGRFYATAFQTTSDATHKTNITRLDNPLERIRKVEGYSYNWKPEFIGYTDTLEYGVTAQQLEEAGFNDLVKGKNDGEKTVNYLGLIPFLIEAIKELSEKVETTENLLRTERKRQLSRRE